MDDPFAKTVQNRAIARAIIAKRKKKLKKSMTAWR